MTSVQTLLSLTNNILYDSIEKTIVLGVYMGKNSKKNETRLIVANIITTLGNRVFDYVNTIFIKKTFQSIGILGIYQNSETIISIIFSFIGGIFGDKHERRKILVLCDVLSSLVCLALLVTTYSKKFVTYVIIANILLAIIASFNHPVYMSIPKNFINKERHSNYISKISSWREVARILGPIVGMIFVYLFDIRIAYIFNIITFWFSALNEYKLIEVYPSHAKDELKSNHVILFKEGFEYFISNKNILFLVILSTLTNFFLSGYNLFLPYVRNASVGMNDTYGILLTSEALGGIFAGFVNAKIKKKFNPAYFLAISGIFILLFNYLSSNFIFSVLYIFMFGAFLTLFNIAFSVEVQEFVKDEFISRVWSLITIFALISMPIGAAILTYLYSKFSINVMFVVGFGILLISSIYLIIMGINKTRKEKMVR